MSTWNFYHEIWSKHGCRGWRKPQCPSCSLAYNSHNVLDFSHRIFPDSFAIYLQIITEGFCASSCFHLPQQQWWNSSDLNLCRFLMHCTTAKPSLSGKVVLTWIFLWARRILVSLFTHCAFVIWHRWLKSDSKQNAIQKWHPKRKNPKNTWSIGPHVFIFTLKLSCYFSPVSFPLHHTTIYSQQKKKLRSKRENKEEHTEKTQSIMQPLAAKVTCRETPITARLII